MEQHARLAFRFGAVSNWLVTVGGIIAPVTMATLAGLPPPNYPFLLRIWSGMAFLFGCMFWEISSDPVRRHVLMKYAWIEKCITGTSVTIAYVTGNVPFGFFAFVCFTDWFWVPIFAFFDHRLRPAAAGERSETLESDLP